MSHGQLHGIRDLWFKSYFFLLDDLIKLSNPECIGLYRDNVLMVTNKSKYDQEKLSKNLRSIFKRHGFEITIEKGLFQTEFLDIWSNLQENIYESFRKENAIVKYINNESNHPQNIIIAINRMVNQILCKLFSTMQVFNYRAKPYNALKRNGFDQLRGYMDCEFIRKNKKKKRKT